MRVSWLKEKKGMLKDKGLTDTAEAWYRVAKAIYGEGWLEEEVKGGGKVVYLYHSPSSNQKVHPPPYNSGPLFWTCLNCGVQNPQWRDMCYNCGTHKPHPSQNTNNPESVPCAPPEQRQSSSSPPSPVPPLVHLSPAPIYPALPVMTNVAPPPVTAPVSDGGHLGTPEQRPSAPVYPLVPYNPNQVSTPEAQPIVLNTPTVFCPQTRAAPVMPSQPGPDIGSQDAGPTYATSARLSPSTSATGGRIVEQLRATIRESEQRRRQRTADPPDIETPLYYVTFTPTQASSLVASLPDPDRQPMPFYRRMV